MKRIVYCFFLLSMLAGKSWSQDALRKMHYNIEKGVALSGYDPVSYFTQKKPIKGLHTCTLVNQGVTYLFASDANKALFKANPAKYEPEYGGWCAYAMGLKGEKVSVDPETYKIINNKLYLFYNQFFNNTLKDWNKDEAALKSKADKNWTNTFH
ncbi:MAG: YHS domain protein [Chitinophagaceae bacterium]|nr:YHS domain protein [Chitinophagaceae bacterium]